MSKASGCRLLLSCEHGGARVPAEFARLFAGERARRALAGHRGSDLGALALARQLARALDAPLLAVTVTRLLVEVNRSPNHAALFSEFSRPLGKADRERVLERYYRPHRERVLAAIDESPEPVCHIGVHSFVPELGGERRNADIGLLYDPGRRPEAEFCRAWQAVLSTVDPVLKVRRNYPYRGTADGLTTALRRRFPAPRYLGIELEVNQARLIGRAGDRRALGEVIAASLDQVLRNARID